MMSSTVAYVAALLVATLLTLAQGQTVAPAFAGSYTATSLGSPTGVPGSLGGVLFDAADPDVLLIGGNANAASGSLWRKRVVRSPPGTGHIVGFDAAPASFFANAEFNDGGLVYTPTGTILHTKYPIHGMAELDATSGAVLQTWDLNQIPGFGSSVGSLAFVPQGFPGAGFIKMLSYSTGHIARVPYSIVSGSLEIDLASGVVETTIGGGPEGLAFVAPGSPLVSEPSALVALYLANRVDIMPILPNGIFNVAASQRFIEGLTGAEGATLDPITGDFVFSTFGGGSRVIVVRGFVQTCRVYFEQNAGTCPASTHRDAAKDDATCGTSVLNPCSSVCCAAEPVDQCDCDNFAIHPDCSNVPVQSNSKCACVVFSNTATCAPATVPCEAP